MTDSSRNLRVLLRPLSARSRRRRVIAAVLAGLWLACVLISGSVISGTFLLIALAALAVILFAALRFLGVSMDHRLMRSLTTRPWRDGRDVLQLALRHLPEVFMITPGGSLLAPSAIELCMNPADVESLAAVIDLDLVNLYAAEAYEKEIQARGARILRGVPIEVNVVEDPEIPAGRYRLRQSMQFPGQVHAGTHPLTYPDGITLVEEDSGSDSILTGAETLYEPTENPVLRLVTGDSVTQTRTSPARAGRGRGLELCLPDKPTVSRVHAKFACIAGEWCVTSLGRNGVTVNGTVITREHLIRDGDEIRWGRQPDAPTSHIEII